MAETGRDQEHEHEHGGHDDGFHPGYTGDSPFLSWILTVNHARIGIMYLTSSFFFLLMGGVFALLVRAQLALPGQELLDANRFNEFFTMHGTIMVFLAIIPFMFGIANVIVPPMIGAPDMAFPKLNAWAFWLIPPSGMILLAGFITEISPLAADAGWTSYPPYSVFNPLGQNFWGLALGLLGISSIAGAINFIVTILNLRAPGMTWNRMPLVVWAVFVTSWLSVLGTPVLKTVLIMQLQDRMFGGDFFIGPGSDPLLFQHLFWFYSHPAVYIMILPVMGVVSDILPVFSRKPIFGYKAIAYSSVAIGFLGFVVWGHHMFTTGMGTFLTISFMIFTFIIAVPSGIKVFSWIATIWQGSLDLKTPMLFALGFVSLFIIGGLSGIFLASVPVDIFVHDTYFVVAHLHYVLFGGSLFGIFAGLYYWWPKMTGKMYDETLGQIHFWLTFIGFNSVFLPMHWLGTMGMPRRIFTYPAEYGAINLFISLSAFYLGMAQLIVIYNVVKSYLSGARAGSNPWGALTLEWALPSPLPEHNFGDHPPRVVRWPYQYEGIPVNTPMGDDDPVAAELKTQWGDYVWEPHDHHHETPAAHAGD